MNPDKNILYVPPQRWKLIFSICLIPLLIICHTIKFELLYTYALLGGAVGAMIVGFWQGGFAFKMTPDGAETYRYGHLSRSIPWNEVNQIVIIEDKTFKEEELLLVLKGCYYDANRFKPLGFFHEYHPFRTIYVERGHFRSYIFSNLSFEVVIQEGRVTVLENTGNNTVC